MKPRRRRTLRPRGHRPKRARVDLPEPEDDEPGIDDSPDSFLDAILRRIREIDLEEDLSEMEELVWYRVQERLGQAPVSRRRVRGQY